MKTQNRTELAQDALGGVKARPAVNKTLAEGFAENCNGNAAANDGGWLTPIYLPGLATGQWRERDLFAALCSGLRFCAGRIRAEITNGELSDVAIIELSEALEIAQQQIQQYPGGEWVLYGPGLREMRALDDDDAHRAVLNAINTHREVIEKIARDDVDAEISYRAAEMGTIAEQWLDRDGCRTEFSEVKEGELTRFQKLAWARLAELNRNYAQEMWENQERKTEQQLNQCRVRGVRP